MTLYTPGPGGGACTFGAADTVQVASINEAQWAGSAVCGACVRVTGPLGSTVVRIVDQCLGCPNTGLDLSQDAFAAVADPNVGLAQGSWEFVPCEVTGNVSWFFRAGSSAFFLTMQVRNHRHPIASLEIRGSGGAAFQVMERQPSNAFSASPVGAAAFTPPITVRATDVFGNVVEEQFADILADQTAPGTGQFAAQCN